jgi:DNA-binding winged helix-turn-helix (wHTH) protein/tetratricopeptide (TPR) repeat protein
VVAVLSTTHKLLRFGVYELNLTTEELHHSGTLVKLPPQAFKLLALLASRAGEIVSRDEIQKLLWGDQTFVDFEKGVNKCILFIRNALNDKADHPLYVETIPRRGYRFLAPVKSKILEMAPAVIESGPGTTPVARLTDRLPNATISAGMAAPAPHKVSDTRFVNAPIDGDEGVSSLQKEPRPSRDSKANHGQRRLLVYGIVLAALLAAVVIYPWHSNGNQLQERDTIVLADFSNATGETVFDDTLKQALRIQLEQSPFLNLVSDQKVNATLRLTGRSATDRLTPEVTRDICLRMGSKAMLVGSIAQLGSQYVIGIEAVGCDTGDVLAEAQQQANGKEGILKALDRAALTVRHGLGESLPSVQNYATPVEEATTPSLAALKAYSLARKMSASKGDIAALPLYQQAVALDPNFAMAYRYMSAAYVNLNEVGQAAENARKAYELREKVSERERFIIQGHYYLTVTGELEKAVQTYETAKRAYPRDPSPYISLVFIFSTLGDYERAVSEGMQVLRLDPKRSVNYSNLASDYMDLNRMDDAGRILKEAENQKLGGEWLVASSYAFAFLKQDLDGMAELVSSAAGKPTTEDMLLSLEADTEAWFGRLHNASELTRRATESARRTDARERIAAYQVAAALREVESGWRQEARDKVRTAVNQAPNRDVRAMAALALARAGDTAGAESLASQLSNEFPLGTLVQSYWLPTIRAAVALDRRDPNRAIELLELARPLELATPASLNVAMCPVYVRGQAYLMLHHGNAARTEFQKFIDHPGIAANFYWGALARLYLARAYALDGATDPVALDKARAAYQDFLRLWKDADPDVPLYKQAKVEYSRLR